ncbi:hypothetical protein EDB83DRAFT_361952 [Lactarius deliciosus]|nr:hypothetical protein EDB83DRAFT_361952 [Lactarius deliciosus]
MQPGVRPTTRRLPYDFRITHKKISVERTGGILTGSKSRRIGMTLPGDSATGYRKGSEACGVAIRYWLFTGYVHRTRPTIGLWPPLYYFATHWMLFAITKAYIATVRHRAFTASDPYPLCVHDAPSSSSTRFVEWPTPPVNPKRASLSNTTASRSYGALNHAHFPSPTRVLMCKEPQENASCSCSSTFVQVATTSRLSVQFRQT